ncbi:tumor necrosis factor receptor superfamily member 18 isoform X2 [Octodon degus]|uniref:Tumor necrosis factor receptor superfamily member 18 isoform X2 n=1 Tax=Octodon degus TaxID=10160 RepID=A0A6P6D5B6_OCTDE|nr:tumor necrosis factor receptor superfamily member 18 isoform X2 [Octodon degus]
MGPRAALSGLALLSALSLGPCLSKGPCGPGRFPNGTGTHLRCCSLSAPREAGKTYAVRDCECVQPEYHCGDPECQSCKYHPCPPGTEAQPEGKLTYGFTCVSCAVGTFSQDHQGRCKPWADCGRFGFLTKFPGNKTHNAVCLPGPLPTEPHSWMSTVLLAVASCILVLATIQLGLHLWQLRRQPVWPQGQLCPDEEGGGPRPGADHSPLQRPSHSWRGCHHLLRTPAAASSQRKSGESGWRRRDGQGTSGCEPGHPQQQLHQSQALRARPGQSRARPLLWARPCSLQWWKWVEDGVTAETPATQKGSHGGALWQRQCQSCSP